MRLHRSVWSASGYIARPGTTDQCRRRSGFFLSGDRMRADKMDAVRHRRFSLFHQHSLHATDITDNGSWRQAMGPVLEMIW